MAENPIVKVASNETGKLLWWETVEGRPLAIVLNGSLVLTRLGAKQGYKASGMGLTQSVELREHGMFAKCMKWLREQWQQERGNK